MCVTYREYLYEENKDIDSLQIFEVSQGMEKYCHWPDATTKKPMLWPVCDHETRNYWKNLVNSSLPKLTAATLASLARITLWLLHI